MKIAVTGKGGVVTLMTLILASVVMVAVGLKGPSQPILTVFNIQSKDIFTMIDA